MCFHAVVMDFLGRRSFLIEVLDNRSDFKFLHFTNFLMYPTVLSKTYFA